MTLLDKLDATVDFVQVFVRSRLELEGVVHATLRVPKSVACSGCDMKGIAKVKADLNRASLSQAMIKFGQTGVSLVSVDDVWSAMRFRPADKVGTAS